MTVAHLGLIAAFAAGVVSFLSPCVFPLVPGYLSYIAGTTVRDVQGETGARWRVSVHALFFVVGFALIFALLGAIASSIGATLNAHKLLLERVAGLLLVLFGLFLTGLVRLPVLSQESRVHVAAAEPALLRSALVGVAFGAGWSPCIGPVLGSILALAAAGTTLAQGVLLLVVYSLGLGIPFLLAALFVQGFARQARRVRRYFGVINGVAGGLLVLMGLLVYTGTLLRLASLFPGLI
jgi:cytochrome c-type biogenesis protein